MKDFLSQPQDQVNARRMSNKVKIFVHGLHPLTTEQDIKETFQAFCKIYDLDLKRADIEGTNRGYAFFSVSDMKTAEGLIHNQHFLHGRKIFCDLKHASRSQEKKSHMRRVFVTGIARSISDDDISQHFSRFGKIRVAYTIKDIQGVRKNYGYVDFYDEKAAARAINNSPMIIKGREIEARPFKKKGSINRNKKFRNFKKSSRKTRPYKKTPKISQSLNQGQDFSYKKNSTKRAVSFNDYSHQTHYSHSDFHHSQIAVSNNLSPREDHPQKNTHLEIHSNASLHSPPMSSDPSLSEASLLQERLPSNGLKANLTLPDLSTRNVLGCFMNKRGEQVKEFMKQYVNAVMCNDNFKAQIYFEKIKELEARIFNGDYMCELGKGFGFLR